MDIRDRIKQVLAQNTVLNPTKVSLAAGLSNSALHKFLKGEIQSFTVDKLVAIAEALGVSSRWLIFGDGPRMPAEVGEVWDSILDSDKPRALRVLRSFSEHEGTKRKPGSC